MTDQWYIENGGIVEGPLPVTELQERAANGRLRPTDNVSTDRETWVRANSLAGLAFTTQPSRPLVETVVSGSVHLIDLSASPHTRSAPAVSVAGYQILGEIGSGAWGVVYKARHEKLNRVVALKTVMISDKATQGVIDFKQEAISLARLQHPNIVAVYDGGVCETPKDQVYFAMELLDGEDLAARVERTGPLDERAAWLIARQTAAALAHAVTHGVIHRDVKPANLFLVTPPTGFPLPPDVPMVKVTDFGLALAHGEAGSDSRHDAAGVLLGTPVYMAPEQFTGSNVDLRADIYSLGASMYHVLTGQMPFDGRTVWEVMMKKSAPLPRLQPPISSATADLVAAMMAKSLDERPANYAELIRRIDALPCLDGVFGLSGSFGPSGRMPAAPAEALVQPPSLGTSNRKRWLYVVVGIAFSGMIAGIAMLTGAFRQPVQQTKPPDVLGPNIKLATYVAGSHELLYKSGSLTGWTPAGGSWEIEQDNAIEKTPVLAGTGVVVRRFHPPTNFRVILSIDPHKAHTVEVQIAESEGPPVSATHWLVRLDRNDGVAFGKRVGTGAFELVGGKQPLPSPRELAEMSKRPYLEVKYERTGEILSAHFRGTLLGAIPDNGLKTTEFRVQALGGPVRIDYAAMEELIEQK